MIGVELTLRRCCNETMQDEPGLRGNFKTPRQGNAKGTKQILVEFHKCRRGVNFNKETAPRPRARGTAALPHKAGGHASRPREERGVEGKGFKRRLSGACQRALGLRADPGSQVAHRRYATPQGCTRRVRQEATFDPLWCDIQLVKVGKSLTTLRFVAAGTEAKPSALVTRAKVPSQRGMKILDKNPRPG